MMNISASVRARLTNIAKQTGRDFDAILLQYFQERFLYRISISPYKKKFILKGALLFLIYKMPFLRPTKDIDFLVNSIPNDLQKIKSIVEDIARIDDKDGVVFIQESISAESIIEDAVYKGLRIKVKATMDSTKKLLQLDIAFSDVIVEGPIEMNFPILLEDMPVPNIHVYSKESAVAEKFEAIVKLNVITSRMKDFYDILFLAQHETFQIKTLHKAICETFNNRMTSLEDKQTIFSEEFKSLEEKQVQWFAFLKRSILDSYRTFEEVIDKLQLFIEPVCNEQLFSTQKNTSWNPGMWKWQ